MRKEATLTVYEGRGRPLPADDWSKKQQQIDQRIDRPSITPIYSDPNPCGTCFPEMEWLFGFPGGSYNVYNDRGVLVGVIDDNGVYTPYSGLSSGIAINSVTALVAGSIYSIPNEAAYITDVWFDDLYAIRDVHYTYSPHRTIEVIPTIDPGTEVRIAYVTL